MGESRVCVEENPGIYKLLQRSNIQIVICLRPWFFLHVSQTRLILKEIILLRKVY